MNGMRRMMGVQGIRVEMQGIKVGLQVIGWECQGG